MPESKSKKEKETKIPPLPDLPDYSDSSSYSSDVNKALDEAYIDWINSFKDCFEANKKMFKTILKGFMKPFWLSVGMNVTIFVVGMVGFSLAMLFSLFSGEYLFSLVFGGMDGLTFLAFFLSNPIKNLEKDMAFVAWLGLIYNTYWARSYYATDLKTFQNDQQDITDDAVQSLQRLLETHKELNKFDLLKTKSDTETTKEGK